MQDGKNNRLLIPGKIRIDKQKQYYLLNYKCILDTRARKKQKDEPVSVDADITIHLLQRLSNRNYIYHNMYLETNLIYETDYDSICWSIPSLKNRQKVNTFKLEQHCEYTIIVSKKGTINISIQCTFDPYEFHTPSGLIEFFGSCGQALSEIQEAANNRLYVVPPIPDWNIHQFDYGKDIPSMIPNADPKVVSWTAQGILRIKDIGTVFQAYPKGIPDIGECTRFEGHYNTKEDKELKDIIPDVIDKGNNSNDSEYGSTKDRKNSPFVTAEELLKKNQLDDV